MAGLLTQEALEKLIAPRRLTDDQLFKMAHRLDVIKSVKGRAEAQIEKLQERLTKELDQRKVKDLTSDDDYKVGKQQNSRVEHDEAGFLASLTPSQRELCTVPAVDWGAVQELIQQGKIRPAKLARFSTVRWSKPFINTSGKGKVKSDA